MSLIEGASSSSPVRRKPRSFKTDTLVKATQHIRRLHAEIHPPSIGGKLQTIEIPLGTQGIVCGPAPNGEGHIVAFDYGQHRTATAVVSPEYISRL